MITSFWFNDISVLYKKDNLFEIIPLKNNDLNQKLNSIFRLSIYYTIIMYLLKKDSKLFFIPVATGLFTIMINKNHLKTKGQETQINLLNDIKNEDISNLETVCKIPQKDNPFMNPLVFDPNTNKDSCVSYNNKGIQREIDNQYNNGMYRDISDIFGRNNSKRQFYTVPGKNFMNDQPSFAKWLYKTPETCKEGNGLQCAANQYG
tara:strand:+ start:1348 stop:1962 length:615 start_codon:yes stop_codon:yes gene_type:complete